MLRICLAGGSAVCSLSLRHYNREVEAETCYTQESVYVCVCLCVCVFVCLCVYIYIYIHTFIPLLSQKSQILHSGISNA